MRTVLRAIALLLGLLLVIQLIPVSRDNPPVTGPITAPPEIAATLRKGCYNCHSNETTWPWYSRVAPASWLIAHDVNEGREHLNFSTWTALSPSERQKVLLEMSEEVRKGSMPPGIYTPLHPEARLRLAEINALAAWAEAEATRGAQ